MKALAAALGSTELAAVLVACNAITGASDLDTDPIAVDGKTAELVFNVADQASPMLQDPGAVGGGAIASVDEIMVALTYCP